jgi:hypothetical protein
MSHLHALDRHDSTPPAGRTAGSDTVKDTLTPDRAGRVVENDEYAAFARRVLRAYARRIATGDVEALTLMTDLTDEIDAAISQAVKGLRAYGYSWAEIGSGSASPARPPGNAGEASRELPPDPARRSRPCS